MSQRHGTNSFTLIVVLFVLLVIVGAVSYGGSGCCCVYYPYPYGNASNVPITGYWNA